MVTIMQFIFTPEFECPECLGVGEVEYEFYVIDHIRGGEIIGRVMECRMCEGSGLVTEAPDEDDSA